MVTPSYIYKALIRRSVTCDSGPNPSREHNPRNLFPDQEIALADHMRANPGITPAQTQYWLEAENAVTLYTGALWNAVGQIGLSFKKSPESRRAGPTRCPEAARGLG